MTATDERRRTPAGVLSSRPLHFIWICDSSGSMIGAKIQSLNNAIREAIPHMREIAQENPNAQVLIRALKFSDGAQWHVSQPAPIDVFEWSTDLDAGGLTDMGLAMRMVAEQMKSPPMPERALPPVLVLITDGIPTDDFKSGLNALMAEPWGKKAVRVAIAIGNDAELETLQKFIGNQEIKPLVAQNADQLIRFIKWASTATIQSASSPMSQSSSGKENATTNVPLPPPPVVAVPSTSDSVNVEDIW